MRKVVKSPKEQEDLIVENDAEDISLWQGEDLIMLFDAKMARKAIKAIKKSMRELGWEE
jgi:hypothetical protein